MAELAASLLRSSDSVLGGTGEPGREVRLAPLASPLPALRGIIIKWYLFAGKEQKRCPSAPHSLESVHLTPWPFKLTL